MSEDIGYSRTSIYQWRKKYLKEGAVALMNNKNIKPGALIEGINASKESTLSSRGVEEMKSQMLDMQLEIDILKETINVLKKDPGIDQTTLKNQEKAVIIDALKNKYSLPLLLQKLDFSKSSYYYQELAMKKGNKYASLSDRIHEIFNENKKRNGYRRIYALLKREGIIISEKIIRES